MSNYETEKAVEVLSEIIELVKSEKIRFTEFEISREPKIDMRKDTTINGILKMVPGDNATITFSIKNQS